uniref:C2 domain-containing protein n=1 Tax=Elaeophora elaphi TaxID=1147741 RepID=A0A0R3S377_9BILA
MFPTRALLFFTLWSSAIHIIQVTTGFSTTLQRGPEKFWISATLLNVEWKQACLTITYCNQPELKMIKINSVNGEKSSFSWQLDQNFEQLSNSAFISHWTEGTPVDIEMSIEIIGIDPKYRFQRSCDQTAATKAFKYEIEEEHSQGSENGSDLGQMIVELRGRCFNATLTVQKHMAVCPWSASVETTTTYTATKVSILNENGFSRIEGGGFLMIICVSTSSLIIVCAVRCVLSQYLKSWKLVKPKAPILPAVQSKSWKVMKFPGNAMSESKNSSSSDSSGNSGRIAFKNNPLISSNDGQIFANSDTIIESDRSSSGSARTYDHIVLVDDIPVQFMIEQHRNCCINV